MPVHSTTKPVAALVIAMLVDEGKLSYDQPIATLWPEFGRRGKGHGYARAGAFASGGRAGLSGEDRQCALARSARPLGSAGETEAALDAGDRMRLSRDDIRLHRRRNGAAGERTLAGRDPARRYLCAARHRFLDRVARVRRWPRRRATIAALAARSWSADRRQTRRFHAAWAAPRADAAWRRVEIPSANGHGTALSVAQLFSAYANAGKIGDMRLIDPQTFSELTAQRINDDDLVMPFRMSWAAGVMINNNKIYGPNSRTLAHAGRGGSFGLGDPGADFGGLCDEQTRPPPFRLMSAASG